MSAAVARIVNHSDLAQAQQAFLHNLFGRAPGSWQACCWPTPPLAFACKKPAGRSV